MTLEFYSSYTKDIGENNDLGQSGTAGRLQSVTFDMKGLIVFMK
jgi:hypothetical protein